MNAKWKNQDKNYFARKWQHRSINAYFLKTFC